MPGKRPKKPARSKAAKALPVTLPSKHTPGFLDRLDRRAAYPKLLLSRRDALLQDLGGADALSIQQRTLAERAIYLHAVVEEIEASHAKGTELDLFKYIAALNALCNLFKTLGLHRAVKRANSLEDFQRGFIEGKANEE